MDRPAASDRMKERAQSEEKGGSKEKQRGEAPTPSERSKQAQEPQRRESREPTRKVRISGPAASVGPRARRSRRAGSRVETANSRPTRPRKSCEGAKDL
jgi:hypothetical protein